MSLLDKIPQDEKYKINIQHHSENVEIWYVLLDNMTLKVKHWKIEDKSEDLTLREIWLNEVRQLNRLKSIGNSSKYLELLYKSDIDEIKSEYLEGLTFHYVKEMSEVLAIAITNQKVKNAKDLK